MDQFPFHATQIVYCRDIDVPEEFLNVLLRIYNVDSETLSETKFKTDLIGLYSSSSAMGFGSIFRIIYGWVKLLPLVAYKNYFKWYRGLFDTMSQEFLVSVHYSEWGLGGTFNLLFGWKRIELEGRNSQFEESCCTLFGILRDVSHGLCRLSDLVFKTSRIEPRNIQKWITTIHSCLLDRH